MAQLDPDTRAIAETAKAMARALDALSDATAVINRHLMETIPEGAWDRSPLAPFREVALVTGNDLHAAAQTLLAPRGLILRYNRLYDAYSVTEIDERGARPAPGSATSDDS